MQDQLRSPIVRFGIALGALFFLLGGPISGYFLTRIFLEAKASSDWPSVDGMITKAQVGRTAVGRYLPDVVYTYQVGDRKYAGSRVRASDGESEYRSAAAQDIEGLTVGNKVPVFYDPADPKRSLLQTGAGFQEYVLLAVPIGIFAIGVGAVLVLWRTRGGAGNGENMQLDS